MSSLAETNLPSDVLEYPAHHLKVGTTNDQRQMILDPVHGVSTVPFPLQYKHPTWLTLRLQMELI